MQVFNLKLTKQNFIIQLIKILNIIMITIPFGVCWYKSYRFISGAGGFYFWGHIMLITFFAALYFYFVNLYEGLNFTYSHIAELVYSHFLSIGLTDAIIYIVICLLSKKFVNIIPGLICFAVQIIFATVWSYFTVRIYFGVCPPSKTAVIFNSRGDIDTLVNEYSLAKRFDVKKSFVVEDCINNLSVLNSYEVLFLSDLHSEERNVILKYCVENNIQAYILPRIGDVVMSGAKRLHMFHLPVFYVTRYNPSLFYLFLKRVFDIFVSAVGLILLSPVIAVTSFAIKRNDGGPVFYKQNRLTKDGKEFLVYKFRSMRVDSEKNGAQLSSGENDDRITPVGRVIRKLRIDEIPQLINILKGEMTIVGPRPERPEISAVYEESLPEFRLRLQAKAGLTGYAQVYGKYNTAPRDKLLMDLMYISKPSVWEDIKILLATVKIIFMPESTEGVAEGQTTAMTVEK